MPRETAMQNRTGAIAPDSPLPNLVTIVASGVAEGAIDVGVQRFRFSGRMANIRLVDWNGDEALDSPSVPTVHVAYGAPNR
ncbi:hypothetical protein [Natrinema gari]|nr:hypothetical protein [Natrinema gari]